MRHSFIRMMKPTMPRFAVPQPPKKQGFFIPWVKSIPVEVYPLFAAMSVAICVAVTLTTYKFKHDDLRLTRDYGVPDNSYLWNSPEDSKKQAQ